MPSNTTTFAILTLNPATRKVVAELCDEFMVNYTECYTWKNDLLDASFQQEHKKAVELFQESLVSSLFLKADSNSNLFQLLDKAG